MSATTPLARGRAIDQGGNQQSSASARTEAFVVTTTPRYLHPAASSAPCGDRGASE